MRRTFLILVLTTIPGMAGQQMEIVPIHNSTVALEIGGYAGHIGYVCETQPRQYCGANGCYTVTDRYVQLDPCPSVPVD